MATSSEIYGVKKGKPLFLVPFSHHPSPRWPLLTTGHRPSLHFLCIFMEIGYIEEVLFDALH